MKVWDTFEGRSHLLWVMEGEWSFRWMMWINLCMYLFIFLSALIIFKRGLGDKFMASSKGDGSLETLFFYIFELLGWM